MSTAAVATSLVGNLILARLLTSGKRAPGPHRVRADVERFFRGPLSSEQWQGYVNELVEAGLLETRPYKLTDAGRQHALEFLGTDALPPGADWGTVQARYLVPKALGLSPGDAQTRGRIANARNLGTYLLKKRYGLPPETTLTKALDAIVCRELGHTEAKGLDDLRRSVLSHMLGSSEKLTIRQIQEQLPRHIAGAPDGDAKGLREAILREWVSGETGAAGRAAETYGEPGAASREPLAREEDRTVEIDLSDFAATVQAAARDCPSGRIGANKVFINHVWRYLQREPNFPPLGLPKFKEGLAKASHDGLLHLERADPAQAPDADDVRESETHYGGDVFHLVALEGSLP